MDDKLMYILNDDKQNYPICRLYLLWNYRIFTVKENHNIGSVENAICCYKQTEIH